MAHYGAESPKPSTFWGNSQEMMSEMAGQLRLFDLLVPGPGEPDQEAKGKADPANNTPGPYI